MSRIPKPTDYIVPVEGLGSFTFGRRTMRDEVVIQVEFARLIDGVEPTAWLQAVGGWMSSLKVLTVRAPEGWNVDEMDPLDDETYSKLKRVHDALTAKEGSFRRKPEPTGQGGGEGADKHNPV